MTPLLGDCEKCPLNDRPVVSGFGPHGGLAIVGEAPGASEARRGRPFVGDAGAVLRQTLRALGQDPNEVYMTNAVVRHPLGNKTPTMMPIRACQHRLMDELAEVRPTKILTVGGVALTAILQAGRVLPITKMRGRAQWVEIGGLRTLLVPTVHPSLVMRDPDMFRDFAADMKKWLEVDEPLPYPDVETVVVETVGELEDELGTLSQASVLSCDLETTGFHPIQNDLLSVGFGAMGGDDSGYSVIIPRPVLFMPQVREMLWEFMWDEDRPLVFHNAKFDLQFLQTYFDTYLPLEARIADTMLMHYLTDERPIGRYLGHGLKDLARIRYDIEDYRFDFEAFYEKAASGEGLSDQDWDDLYAYQGMDCYVTARLYYDLVEEIRDEKEDLLKVHDEILIPSARAFAEAEVHGTYIDRQFFEGMASQLDERLEQHLAFLKKEIGTDFNPGSAPQVTAAVKGLGGDLKPVRSSYYSGYREQETSTDRETLELVIRRWGVDDKRSKIVQAIIDYRIDLKVRQTYIEGLLERTTDDSRIRPDFQLAGTATGRLSCRNPNFQNIPAYMDWNVRQGFSAPPGYVFMEADYSQLELRVSAWLSQDPDLIQVFASGKDIHMEVAVAMFHKPEDEITAGERYMAKRVDFGILYGRSAKALAEGPEMDYLVDKLGGERWSIEEAEVYVSRFLDGYPRLRDWMKEIGDSAVRNQYVDTPLGRRRRFPFIARSMVGHLRRQAVNTPIQSVASDLCLTALSRVSASLGDEAHVLFSVHDSIALEVREDALEEVSALIREEMEQGAKRVLGDDRGIPFPCDIEVGPNWHEVKKI